MIPNKKIFGMMLPGDYVKIKTVGQLIDTGWYIQENGVLIHELSWAGVVPEAMDKHLGQLCQIKEIKVHPNTGELYVTLEEDDLEFCYTYEMMYELYPLARGLV